MTTTTLHIPDPDLKVDPHSVYLSRGAGPVLLHLDREGGSVDCWLIERGQQPRSMGIASSVVGCGCP